MQNPVTDSLSVKDRVNTTPFSHFNIPEGHFIPFLPRIANPLLIQNIGMKQIISRDNGLTLRFCTF